LRTASGPSLRPLCILATLVALSCGGASGAAGSSAASGAGSGSVASGPYGSYVAILASAPDPNTIEDQRTDVVDRLGEARELHVVLVQGACYTGIPSRYADGYVLALEDRTRSAVQADLTVLGREPGWEGEVQVTCLD
jgi:hypothetical protein